MSTQGSGTLINLYLQSERPIWCWKYVAAYTYDGYMVRTHSKACNDHMLECVKREATSYFGEWPIHVIEPLRPSGVLDYPQSELPPSLPHCR
jgi:hypothetical protein